MKLEILRDEIRIVPENGADEVYLKSIASKEDQAKAKLDFRFKDSSVGYVVGALIVKPFCCGEGPSRPS